jgi:hypothetical protein
MSVVAVDQADRAQMQLGALLEVAALARRDAEALATARSDLQARERAACAMIRPAGLAACRRGCGRHCVASKYPATSMQPTGPGVSELRTSRKSSDFRYPDG